MTASWKKIKWSNVNIQSALRFIYASLLLILILSLPCYALTPAQVFDEVKDSVLVVKSFDATGSLKAQGSGVLLPSGKIATNCHVVEGGISYKVGCGNQLVTATLFAEDGDKDICILDAQGITGKPVQLGKAADLKVGESVYAVGAPQGLELSLSDGIVAQLRGGPPPLIQTTAAISPGSSGGGLFDGGGRLVGLTTFYMERGQSLNFAMPVEWIAEVKQGRKPVAEGRSEAEWVKRAIALAQLKDWPDLLDWCLKWLESEPDSDYAWYCLGTAYEELKRYSDAIEAFRQAVRINSENKATWYHLGLAYNELGQTDKAIEAYQQAVRIYPDDADIWFFLGCAYNKLEQTAKAIEAYQQAVRIAPGDYLSWKYMGLSYFTLDRYDDTITSLSQATQIDHEDAEIWYFLGGAYDKSGQTDKAIEAYRQTVRINPKDADAWRGLGLIYYERLHIYEDAIKSYRQALSIEPNNARIWYELGNAYCKINLFDDGINAYRQAVRINPKDVDSWYNLGVTYGELNRLNDAIKAYQQAVRVAPEHAKAWYNLGLDYLNSDNRKAALKIVTQLRRIDSELADKLHNIIMGKQGTYGGAWRPVPNTNWLFDASRVIHVSPSVFRIWTKHKESKESIDRWKIEDPNGDYSNYSDTVCFRQIDCKTQKIGTVNITNYSAQGTTIGDSVTIEDSKIRMSLVIPDSVGEACVQTVCDYIKKFSKKRR